MKGMGPMEIGEKMGTKTGKVRFRKGSCKKVARSHEKSGAGDKNFVSKRVTIPMSKAKRSNRLRKERGRWRWSEEILPTKGKSCAASAQQNRKGRGEEIKKNL